MQPVDRPEGPRTGRHRDPRRSLGPLGLAVLVLVILGGLGTGAALLPSSLVGTSGSAGQGAGAGPGDRVLGAEGAGDGSGNSAPVAPDVLSEPSPTVMPSVTAKPSPTRPPVAKKTPTQAPTRRTATSGSSGGSGSGGSTTGSTAGGTQQRIIDEVNRQRVAGGCGRVTANARLTRAAQLHSEDQAEHDTMSHDGSDGSTPWDRARRAGYDRAIGENVAAGYRDVAAVMEGWMNSPGHRANIMNCDAKAIGVGLANSDDGTPYWTQMFGSVA